jgi:hypothetical protein
MTKIQSNVGKVGIFRNPLYSSIDRKPCVIVNDWLREDRDNIHRYGIKIVGEEKSMAARECEVQF